MRTRRCFVILLLLAGGGGIPPAFARDALADELMQRVQMSMPEVPLELDATIRAVSPAGRPLRAIKASAHLMPREDGRTTRYTLFDAFGSIRQEMTVDLSGGSAVFSFAAGDPPQEAPLPDLFESIESTEINWMELSFAFFWWPNPRIVGVEQVANRWECHIIEIDCPPEYPDGWSHIRLWVAPAYNAVIRGEAWQEGRAVKRFEVKSVRRLRQVYMIGDMEVRNLVTARRARLHVNRMRMVSPDYTDEELEEFNAPVAW